MKASIDRIGEGVAVLVTRSDPPEQIRVPVRFLPSGCAEGDVLDLTFEVDPVETAAAGERVSGLIEKLKKKR
jgi:hypothetical protein